MAGGQERILRRRIRSVQSTKKITRAMELIAASRIVKAQQRVAAAGPTASRSPRSSATWPRPAAARAIRCSPAARRGQDACLVVITADRGLAGGYNAGVIRAAEGAIKADGRAGHGLLDHRRRPEGRELLPLPRLPLDAVVHRLQRQPDLRGRPGHRPPVIELLPERRGRPGRARLHPVRLGRLQEVVLARWCPSSAAITGAATPSGADGDGPAAATSSSRARRRSSTRCCPATSRPASSPPCLNAAASEQAARQRAMKSATDNAEELIKSLSRS